MLRMPCLIIATNFLILAGSWANSAQIISNPVAPCDEPFPVVASVKGLQVQMVDDALRLGVKHAGLNIDLCHVMAAGRDTDRTISWTYQGQEFLLNDSYLRQLDRQIKPLSDGGVVVTLILLNFVPDNLERRRIATHPRYDPSCPNRLSAFNVVTEEGRNWLEATVAHLAWRWSRPNSENGRVWNWIVGNEVNSHWFWSNCGRVEMSTFADEYLVAVRLVLSGVRRYSRHGRVYVSLEHHWNIRYAGGDETQTFPARAFLEYLAFRSNELGGVDWHVAFHPYPENLFEPRSWLDQSATENIETSPRITFKNLGTLASFLGLPSMRHAGQTRRLILSEQGFHTPEGDDGEAIQAAAYCYAWKVVEATPAVDAFILHRHVDHAAEGGLRLGLWSNKPGSICEPDRPKRSYSVFLAADTDRWEEEFKFALPILGIGNWEELRPK